MIFTPVNRRVSTIGTMRIHAVNLILSLLLRQVRVMNPHYILKFGEYSK